MAAAGSSGGGARPLLAAASSGDRCRINWTSGEYSPHFVSTCTGEITLHKFRETVKIAVTLIKDYAIKVTVRLERH
jgi:hypothetical protein